jgi:hypothetical protein
MASQEVMEAYLERNEPTPVELEKAATQPEVPNKEAVVETIRALKDRYWD